MRRNLPKFIYHPDPIKTGAIKQSNAQCTCCSQRKGYIYVASIYTKDDSQIELCPWCIADGRAAATYEATFSDAHPLVKAKVPQSIIDEITTRTPGYSSWQQEEWLAHCGDACEFHGDASRVELDHMSSEIKTSFCTSLHLTEQDWTLIKQQYTPGGDPAFYKFICRHCNAVLFGMDCT